MWIEQLSFVVWGALVVFTLWLSVVLTYMCICMYIDILYIYIYALRQMLYLVSDTVFKAVVWRNCTKTSQIVMQRAPCEGRTDVCGVECLNWIIFHSWLFQNWRDHSVFKSLWLFWIFASVLALLSCYYSKKELFFL